MAVGIRGRAGAPPTRGPTLTVRLKEFRGRGRTAPALDTGNATISVKDAAGTEIPGIMTPAAYAVVLPAPGEYFITVVKVGYDPVTDARARVGPRGRTANIQLRPVAAAAAPAAAAPPPRPAPAPAAGAAPTIAGWKVKAEIDPPDGGAIEVDHRVYNATLSPETLKDGDVTSRVIPRNAPVNIRCIPTAPHPGVLARLRRLGRPLPSAYELVSLEITAPEPHSFGNMPGPHGLPVNPAMAGQDHTVRATLRPVAAAAAAAPPAGGAPRPARGAPPPGRTKLTVNVVDAADGSAVTAATAGVPVKVAAGRFGSPGDAFSEAVDNDGKYVWDPATPGRYFLRAEIGGAIQNLSTGGTTRDITLNPGDDITETLGVVNPPVVAAAARPRRPAAAAGAAPRPTPGAAPANVTLNVFLLDMGARGAIMPDPDGEVFVKDASGADVAHDRVGNRGGQFCELSVPPGTYNVVGRKPNFNEGITSGVVVAPSPTPITVDVEMVPAGAPPAPTPTPTGATRRGGPAAAPTAGPPPTTVTTGPLEVKKMWVEGRGEDDSAGKIEISGKDTVTDPSNPQSWQVEVTDGDKVFDIALPTNVDIKAVPESGYDFVEWIIIDGRGEAVMPPPRDVEFRLPFSPMAPEYTRYTIQAVFRPTGAAPISPGARRARPPRRRGRRPGAAGTGSIVVRVRDEKNRPLNGATVDVVGGPTETLAGDASEISFDNIPVGNITVEVSKAEYATDDQTRKVDAGKLTTFIFKLKREKIEAPSAGKATIHGKVTDAKTKDVISAASIRVTSIEPAPPGGLPGDKSSDTKGIYKFSNIDPGKVKLSATQVGYGELRKTVTVGEDEIKEVNFELKKKKEKEVGEEFFEKHFGKKYGKPVGVFLMLGIGLLLVAILGSMWFLLAFICWAVYTFLPSPMNWGTLAKKIKEQEEELEKETDPDVIKKIQAKIELYKGEGTLLKSGELWKSGSMGISFFKEFVKVGGIGFFGGGILATDFPLSVPIGLILMLGAYFMLGGERVEKKE